MSRAGWPGPTFTALSLIDSVGAMSPVGHASRVAVPGGLPPRADRLPVALDGSDLAGEPFAVQAEQVLCNVDKTPVCTGTGRAKMPPPPLPRSARAGPPHGREPGSVSRTSTSTFTSTSASTSPLPRTGLL